MKVGQRVAMKAFEKVVLKVEKRAVEMDGKMVALMAETTAVTTEKL